MYARSRFGQLGRAETRTKEITKRAHWNPDPVVDHQHIDRQGEGGEPRFSLGPREQIAPVNWRGERRER